MEDIDRDGRQEIMLQTLDSLQDSEDGLGNYLLQLPGTRVYHWDGVTFQLTYLYHDGILDRVRPGLPVVYAPYLESNAPAQLAVAQYPPVGVWQDAAVFGGG